MREEREEREEEREKWVLCCEDGIRRRHARPRMGRGFCFRCERDVVHFARCERCRSLGEVVPQPRVEAGSLDK